MMGLHVTKGRPLEYEDRYIAFLDILGFAEMVQQSSTNSEVAKSLHKTMQISASAHEIYESAIEDGTSVIAPTGADQSTIFSDSIVLSSPKLIPLLYDVHSCWISYAEQGFFIRGGISSGQVIHMGRLVYGPAMITAYRLESEVARVPRIVIDPAIPVGPEYYQGEVSADVLEYVIGNDSDGYNFIHPFTRFATEQSIPFLENRLENVRNLIEQQLGLHTTNHAITSKFQWLAREFNSHLEKYDGPRSEMI